MTSEDEAAHLALPATAAVVPDGAAAAPVRSRVEERAQVGRAARHAVPRAAHAAWSPPAERGDPVVLLAAQNVERVPWLVPIRHGRMTASPLAFYRGAAMSLVKSLPEGRRGAVYPDMPWEPKEAVTAVASHFAHH